MSFVFAAENVLPNGAVIEAFFQRGDFRLVLARWERGLRMEWVTWRCDEAGNCFWGYYHGGSQIKGLEDFEQRCKEAKNGTRS